MVSADGRYVLFHSSASNLVAGQTDTPVATPDVFVHDAMTNENTLVSRSLAGATTAATGRSGKNALSDDGRWGLFTV